MDAMDDKTFKGLRGQVDKFKYLAQEILEMSIAGGIERKQEYVPAWLLCASPHFPYLPPYYRKAKLARWTKTITSTLAHFSKGLSYRAYSSRIVFYRLKSLRTGLQNHFRLYVLTSHSLLLTFPKLHQPSRNFSQSISRLI